MLSKLLLELHVQSGRAYAASALFVLDDELSVFHFLEDIIWESAWIQVRIG